MPDPKTQWAIVYIARTQDEVRLRERSQSEYEVDLHSSDDQPVRLLRDDFRDLAQIVLNRR